MGSASYPPNLQVSLGRFGNPAKLIVSDDNSSDASVQMLEEFATTAPFPVKLCRNADRRGFAENFLRAASGCTGDAIAFCDQDDVWRKDKLARCVTELIGRDVGLVLHQYMNTDEELRPIGALVPKKSASVVLDKLQTDKDLILTAGCAMVVRRDVVAELIRCWPQDHLERVQEGRSILSHDCAAFYIANGIGRIAYLAEPLLLHRIHEDNTCTISPTFRHSVRRALRMGSAEYQLRSSLFQTQADMYERMAALAAGEAATSLLQFGERLRCLAKMNHERSRLHGFHRQRGCELNYINTGKRDNACWSETDGGANSADAASIWRFTTRHFAHIAEGIQRGTSLLHAANVTTLFTT